MEVNLAACVLFSSDNETVTIPKRQGLGQSYQKRQPQFPSSLRPTGVVTLRS